MRSRVVDGFRLRTVCLMVVLLTAVEGCGRDDASTRPPVAQGEPCEECLCRARFGDPSASAYVLPYPPGRHYRVSQTYCTEHGSHANQLAYDFDIPIGADIVAARGGVVMAVREDLPDDGQGPHAGVHNHVLIRHEDGTVAFYAHLMQRGVDVGHGDTVEQGQRIAASGNSGPTSGPHLHFGVYQYWPPAEGDDVPVNFRNAEGLLDERNGLRVHATYIARPY